MNRSTRSSRWLRLSGWWWLLTVLLVTYGSLLPFELRPLTLEAAREGFWSIPYLELGVQSRADLIANLVVYFPIGFLFMAAWPGRRGALALVMSLLVNGGLAVSIEFTQQFFAPRTVSLNDIAAETLGSLLGAITFLILGGRAATLLRDSLSFGRPALLALLWAYAITWLLLALFPFDFVLNRQELAWKQASGLNAWTLSPALGLGVAGRALILAGETVAAVPLGILWGMRARRIRPWTALVVGLAIGTLAEGVQSLLASGIGQGASVATRALGFSLGSLAAGVDVPALSARLRYRHGADAGALMLLAASMLAAVASTWSGGNALLSWSDGLAKLDRMAWLPFYYHYFTTEAVAVRSLVLNAALYMPVGVFWALSRIQRVVIGRPVGLLTPVLLAAITVLMVETPKLFLSGLHPEPTHLLVGPSVAAAAAGISVQVLKSLLAQGSPNDARPANPRRYAAAWQFSSFAAPMLPGLALAVMLAASVAATVDASLDVRRLATLPHPADVPSAGLAEAPLAHPRLPAPTPEEASRLFRENPKWWESQRQGAEAGRLDSMILVAFLEPGARPLAPLYQRLVSLRPQDRGHEQAMPLAQAYDWLFEQWSDEERARLREQLVLACEHTADTIRSHRLSPYNVVLYNAPLQGLTACAIALNRDDPRGTALFNFAWQMWNERVLPVWRQVMGRNGGWHEGGEYVGIGIGQAVFRLPAMWTRVTGVDYFAQEPGLRGFLDFLIWRIRPDGTHIRIGNGAYFDREVPDLLPLALTYRSAAGARAAGCERLDGPFPTSWPWGPLYEPSLCDPDPPPPSGGARHFDGIGLVVSRTGWEPGSTYVTFKAGDNYWSHVHLDQGSFTIYRGGDLAIDSGVYGPEYGSDHHMNYAYQTVAHNAVTVTDPEDTVPGPAPAGGERAYANDGGQRRVGSGWGVLPAPLDLAEWEAQRDTHETGDMLLFRDVEGITVAVADLAAAYTNRWSGTGSFSARTRRVERYTRTFIHDRVDDVIIVRDDLRLTRHDFTARWLLHSQQKPATVEGGFRVGVPGTGTPAQQGGSLTAYVLEPEDALLTLVGGDGREFEVDGINWDDGGRVQRVLGQRPDLVAGRWRVEVTGPFETEHPGYLVVLLPDRAGGVPVHRVRRISDGARRGCEVVGASRTTRWWFAAGQAGPTEVEIEDASGRRVFGGFMGQSTEYADGRLR